MKNLSKTYKKWLESDYDTIDKYLQPGDIVDKEMYEHFLNIIPPLVYTDRLLQVGEACDFIGGKNTYTTFELVSGNWIYRGECHKNCTVNLQR